MPNNPTLPERLFTIFTAALLGYIWGWMWGWSLYNPNSDVWALLAAVFALAGLGVGLTRWFAKNLGPLSSASIGLYLGWLARTLLFGDTPGGWGILVMAVGAAAGWVTGVRLCHPPEAGRSATAGLLGGLYFGFFGGFIIDVLLLDLLLGWVKTHSILGQAPAVLACGILGGALLARLQSRR